MRPVLLQEPLKLGWSLMISHSRFAIYGSPANLVRHASFRCVAIAGSHHNFVNLRLFLPTTRAQRNTIPQVSQV